MFELFKSCLIHDTTVENHDFRLVLLQIRDQLVYI